MNTKKISLAIYLPSRPRFLGRMPSNLIPQVVYLQVLPFRPYAFKILDKYSPKLRILDPFQQSKHPVCWVPYWLCAKKPAWRHRSQFLSCYCITATGATKYQGAVLVASNEPCSHHPYGGSKGLRLHVKLLTWLGFDLYDDKVIGLQL